MEQAAFNAPTEAPVPSQNVSCSREIAHRRFRRSDLVDASWARIQDLRQEKVPGANSRPLLEYAGISIIREAV